MERAAARRRHLPLPQGPIPGKTRLMGNNRNFILAIFLSVVVFVGWQYFVIEPQLESERARQEAITAASGETTETQGTDAPAPGEARLPSIDEPGTTLPAGVAGSTLAREDALGASPRIAIRSEQLDGSLSLRGARFDDLKLRNYRVTYDPDSAEVALLAPAGTQTPYFAEFGFIPATGSGVKVPDSKAVWQAEAGAELTPQSPVRLRWENGQGLVFHRTIAVDEHYLFTVT